METPQKLSELLKMGKVCVSSVYKCTAANACRCLLLKIGDRSDERGTCPPAATQAVGQKERKITGVRCAFDRSTWGPPTAVLP